MQNYMEPMSKSSLFKESDIKNIFSNVEALYHCNRALLEDLILGGCGSAVFGCNVAKAFIKMARFLNMYTEYVSTHSNNSFLKIESFLTII